MSSGRGSFEPPYSAVLSTSVAVACAVGALILLMVPLPALVVDLLLAANLAGARQRGYRPHIHRRGEEKMTPDGSPSRPARRGVVERTGQRQPWIVAGPEDIRDSVMVSCCHLSLEVGDEL